MHVKIIKKFKRHINGKIVSNIHMSTKIVALVIFRVFTENLIGNACGRLLVHVQKGKHIIKSGKNCLLSYILSCTNLYLISVVPCTVQ